MGEIAAEVQRSIEYLQAFRMYQDESARNMMDLADASARQLVAVHLCLDLAYRARSELSRSESAKDLVEAIEEITITNREIVERITKTTGSLRSLLNRLEKIEGKK